MRLDYFQLVDHFLEVDLAARKIKAVCVVPEQSTILEGHFPGFPILPGVLMIEAMAQTCGWLTSAVTGFTGLPVLAGVKQAKMRNIVRPTQSLIISGEMVHEGSGYAMAKAKGVVDGVATCDAELTYRIIPYPTPDFLVTMKQWAEDMNFPMTIPWPETAL
jgi:3-hydroxyacyl-[acyl-carrier-protein] dehydratase